MRLVHLPGEHPWDAVAARVSILSKMSSVLVIAVREPLALLRRRLVAAGANLQNVFILDTITDALSVTVTDPEHEAYIHGPTLLETASLRAGKIIKAKAKGKAHILVDDLRSLAFAAGAAGTAQWLQSGGLQATPATNLEVFVSATMRDGPLHLNLQNLTRDEVLLERDGFGSSIDRRGAVL